MMQFYDVQWSKVNGTTVEPLMSRHTGDAKKASVPGAGHLREYKNAEFMLVSFAAVIIGSSHNAPPH